MRVETEWTLFVSDNGNAYAKVGAHFIAAEHWPPEVRAAAEALEREHKRPKPLTVDEAWEVFNQYEHMVSMAYVLEAERQRAAEIAAWDAKHGRQDTSDELELARDELRDLRAREQAVWCSMMPTDCPVCNGNGYVGHETNGPCELCGGWSNEKRARRDAREKPAPLVWQEAPEVYPEKGRYWKRYMAGDVCTCMHEAGVRVYDEITHIAGPIPKPVMPEDSEP